MKKIQIIGNVTKDAEVYNTHDKSAVNFTVAVNEKYKDRTGQEQKRTTFVKCVLWVKTAGIASYIKKGLKVYVDGNPETEAYLNKEHIAMANLKIIVKDIQFLNNPNKSETAEENSVLASDNSSETLVPTPDDDLPF